MIEKWQAKINQGFESMDKPVKVTEWNNEGLDKFDNFLTAFGI
jgi:hypothetical protein